MKTAHAIVLGALVIAASILFSNRYNISNVQIGEEYGLLIYKIDKLTGRIFRCNEGSDCINIRDTLDLEDLKRLHKEKAENR